MEEEFREYVPWKSNDAEIVAVHPRLKEELKLRKDLIENETGKPTKGGITTFSAMAAMELKALRQSSDQIIKEVLKLKEIRANKFIVNGKEESFIPYEVYKKLFIFLSVISRKKDNNPIRVEITKIKGLKKNEIKYFW
jgi:hypothetical protein